jgi:hypothetical protein
LNARSPEPKQAQTPSSGGSSADLSHREIASNGVVVAELERQRLLMAELLVRSLQQNLITDDAFLKKTEVLDAPGGPEKFARATRIPPAGLLPG